MSAGRKQTETCKSQCKVMEVNSLVIHVSVGFKFPLESTVHFPGQAKPRRLAW